MVRPSLFLKKSLDRCLEQSFASGTDSHPCDVALFVDQHHHGNASDPVGIESLFTRDHVGVLDAEAATEFEQVLQERFTRHPAHGLAPLLVVFLWQPALGVRLGDTQYLLKFCLFNKIFNDF